MDQGHRRSRTPSTIPVSPVTDRGSSFYSASGEKTYTLKFVMTGACGTGKTQLASRIVRGEFQESSLPTVGMEFSTRSFRYAEHSRVRAQIWDTGGEIPFKSITEAFFRGAVGAMIVYDISRRSTFDDVTKWLSLVRENCHESIALILVGNKSDMSSTQREVSMVEGMRFARKHGLDFLETSALQDENVEVVCRQVIMSVARYLPQEKSVWSSKKPAYPLPAGWVRVWLNANEDEGTNSPKLPLSRSAMRSAMPPPPPPKQTPTRNPRFNRNNSEGDKIRFVEPSTAPLVRALWYENTWTGEKVAQRPVFPAGPSDVCVVSQVPRPLDPLTFLADPVKAGKGGAAGTVEKEKDAAACAGAGEKAVEGGLFGLVGLTPSWSFSSLKSKGYAAASDCLSKCMDA